MARTPTIVLFEDDLADLAEPLHTTRASWDILLGTGTMADLIPFVYPKADVQYSCRTDIAPLYETTEYATVASVEPGDYLFLNGRVIDPWSLPDQIPLKGKEDYAAITEEGGLVAIRVTLEKPIAGDLFQALLRLRNTLPTVDVPVTLAKELWTYVAANSGRIASDATHANLGTRVGVVDGAVLLNKNAVFVGSSSVVEPGAVLDARQGPIIIADNVTIGANSVLRGPVFIDDQTIVNPLTIIRESSIGHTCKVGGEISESIIHPYSNKQHGGSLGHAILGSWVNLGSGTTNSDLKNTYGTVRVPIGGEERETQEQFIGCFLGDHVKTGIGTLIPTGAVYGAGTNLLGGGIMPKSLPPCIWYDTQTKKQTPYDPQKFLQVVERTMARRGQAVSAGVRQVLSSLASRRTAK